MSRIGKRPVALPSGVSVNLSGSSVQVKGPKGSLSGDIPGVIQLEVADDEVRLLRPDEKKETRALHGLARALVANMINGVSEGFRKELEIQGVGYRADVAGKVLKLALGFSHPVEMAIPEGITVSVEENRVRLEGADRQAIGQFASEIRAMRPPEPYKGKGVRYADEQIRRKVGKAGAA